jgi:tyrosyl-tRNA synthetase
MSSSWGNVINLIDSPTDKFGKMMAVPDANMAEYLFVLPRSACPFTAEELGERMKSENPRDLKLELAFALTTLYHGEEVAEQTKQAYIQQFSEGGLPADIEEVEVSGIPQENGGTEIVGLLVHLGLAPSRSEARRLIEQGGVRIDEQVQSDVFGSITPQAGMLIQVGKRNFRRLV